MGDIVRHSKGVVCYYLRITPELADEVTGDGGFFYTKKKRVETFIKQPLTKILDFGTCGLVLRTKSCREAHLDGTLL